MEALFPYRPETPVSHVDPSSSHLQDEIVCVKHALVEVGYPASVDFHTDSRNSTTGPSRVDAVGGPETEANAPAQVRMMVLVPIVGKAVLVLCA